MKLVEHLQLMSCYQKWAYAKLFDHLQPISEGDYRANLGLFFHSIHGTLNHLLLVEQVWYDRILAEPIQVSSLAEEVCADRNELISSLLQQSDRWIDLIRSINPETLDRNLSFTSMAGGVRSLPLFETLIHVFNHGTHHRGQISAAITILGYAVPEMDLPYYLYANQTS